ncbi:MAG: hypothetical protein NT138_11305 [Planctomycetales bacterium]|jgi:hypothetical protein|nr:hypothetical protein [Planctomycetales bacterium]
MVRLLGLLLLMSGMLASSAPCSAQEAAVADAIQPLVVKFYDITPLVTPRQHHRFNVGSVQVTGGDMGLAGGQGGVGGGGGQMGGGGGGFFNVPAEPVQMGGGGFVGGGYDDHEPSLKSSLEDLGGPSIVDLIQYALADESWESEDGLSLIDDLGHSLMIRQTEKVHAEIAKFLKELTSSVVGNQTYRLEAWWIPVDMADRGNIEQMIAGESEVEDVRQQLTTLQEAKSGHHGTLICRERLTNHVASGNHVPVISGSVPVVGEGVTGDQPIVRTLFLGLMLEATVQAVPEYSVAKDGKSTDQADVTFRTFVTSRDDKGQDAANAGKIDRYSLAKEAAEGTCRLRVGRPTLVSSLSERTSEKSSSSELQLIMLLTGIDE